MRPIRTDQTTAKYKEATQLGVVEFAEHGSTALGKKRSREPVTVASELDTLEQMLQQYWDGEGKWDGDDSRRRFRTALHRIHEGYLDAGQDLANQIGHFCAYCDAPVYSGIQVDHVLPKEWFPKLMFQFDNLLPTCAACSARKAGKPSRSSANADAVKQQFAWPHHFWETVNERDPLPFKYELISIGAPSRAPFLLGEKVDETAYPRLLADYRSGAIRTQEGWVVRENDEGDTQVLALEFRATAVFSPMSGTAHSLVDLSSTSYTNALAFVDHRVLHRTLAFFKALAARDLLTQAIQSGSAPLLDSVKSALSTAIKTTGFWRVWLTVFRDHPDVQSLLIAQRPGTAPRTWPTASL